MSYFCAPHPNNPIPGEGWRPGGDLDYIPCESAVKMLAGGGWAGVGMTMQGSQPLRSAWGAWNVTPTILVPRFLILLSKHLLVTPFWKSPHIESMHLYTSSVPAGLQRTPEGRPPKCGPGCRGKLMVPKLSDAGDPGLGALCSLSFPPPPCFPGSRVLAEAWV